MIDEERASIFRHAGQRFESAYYLTLTFLPPAERQGQLENLVFEGGAKPKRGVDYKGELERFARESDQVLNLLETIAIDTCWLAVLMSRRQRSRGLLA